MEKENYYIESIAIMAEAITEDDPSKEATRRVRKSLRHTANPKLTQIIENIKEIEEVPTRKFSCSICKKSLSTKETLRKHILSLHLKLKPFGCEDCGKKFVFEKALLGHKKIHKEFPQYECVCGKKYEVESSYKDHVRRLHRAVPSSQLACTTCEKSFYDRQTLRMHVAAVHQPKTIKCSDPICKKVFSTISLMHAHYRCHSEECSTCSECGKSFRSKAYLQKHKLTHNCILPYKCNECCKTYFSISHLNQHRKRAHSTAYNFQCVFCGKCFKTKEQLQYHENAHQGEKPFLCDICGYKTAYRNTLYTHKKKVHSKSDIFKEKKVVVKKPSINVQLSSEDSNEKTFSNNSKQNTKLKKISQDTNTFDPGLDSKTNKRTLSVKSLKIVEKSCNKDNLVTVCINEASSLSMEESFLKSSPMNMFWDNEVYPDWVYPDQSSSESTNIANEETLVNQSSDNFPKGLLNQNITLNCTAIDCHSNVATPFFDLNS